MIIDDSRCIKHLFSPQDFQHHAANMLGCYGSMHGPRSRQGSSLAQASSAESGADFARDSRDGAWGQLVEDGGSRFSSRNGSK